MVIIPLPVYALSYHKTDSIWRTVYIGLSGKNVTFYFIRLSCAFKINAVFDKLRNAAYGRNLPVVSVMLGDTPNAVWGNLNIIPSSILVFPCSKDAFVFSPLLEPRKKPLPSINS